MTNEQLPELKPCPFCGGVKHLVLPPTCLKGGKSCDARDRAFPIVRCRGCYVDVPGKDWDQTTQTAIAAWNTRPDHARLEAIVDKQREQIKTILCDGLDMEAGLREGVSRLEAIVAMLMDAAKTYQSLSACYRTGRRPSQKLLNKLAKIDLSAIDATTEAAAREAAAGGEGE